MSQTSSYEHKKFSLKTEDYGHKKFGLRMNKRKNEDSNDKENNTDITAQTIFDQTIKQHQQQPPAKRRQTQPLFRPWLDYEDNKRLPTTKVTQQAFIQPKVLTTIPSNIIAHPTNMIHQHLIKQRSQREQQNRNRNNKTCLLNHRNQQAEQLQLQHQYAAYQQQQNAIYHKQQAAMMQESVRSALYFRHFQQLALQRQQQLFVFGNQQNFS